MNEYWIIGVSGGPDSMYLLYELHKLNKNLVVAHVNYNQRETSLRDQNLTEAYAKKINAKFELAFFEEEIESNFQSEARDYRYKFYQELYKKYNASALYLGHHKDDDIETYIFQKRTKRQTTYPGIKKETSISGMKVIRPLLDLCKEEIIKSCDKLKIPYAIDESNLSLDYTRNQIRHEISKLKKSDKDAIYQELLAEKDKKEAYNASLIKLNNPFLIDEYLALNKDIRLDSLRLYFENNGLEPYEFTHVFLLDLDKQIANGKSQIEIDNFILSISYNEVMLHQDLSFSYKLNDLEFKTYPQFSLREKGETIEGITLSKEDFPITIRSFSEGDEIKMRFGTKTLRRFFIDRKIPIHRRKSWPVVENNAQEIVFVMGLGCDVNHYSNNPSIFVVK